MHIHSILLSVLLSPLGLVLSDEAFLQVYACCTYKGPDLEDVEYDMVNRVNNRVLARYNSTTGNYTGYTPFAMEIVKDLNKQPEYAIQRAFEKRILCTNNRKPVKEISYMTLTPTVKLNSLQQPSVLVCSAYDFYPKQIRVSWLRNGQEVTSGVSFTEPMPNGDWSYQVHSFLESTLMTRGEQITCRVEHFSLSEPMLVVWDTSLPASERAKIAIGTFLLVLGFVLMSTGFIYYKKKTRESLTLCQGRVVIPVEDFPATEDTQDKKQQYDTKRCL